MLKSAFDLAQCKKNGKYKRFNKGHFLTVNCTILLKKIAVGQQV